MGGTRDLNPNLAAAARERAPRSVGGGEGNKEGISASLSGCNLGGIPQEETSAGTIEIYTRTGGKQQCRVVSAPFAR